MPLNKEEIQILIDHGCKMICESPLEFEMSMDGDNILLNNEEDQRSTLKYILKLKGYNKKVSKEYWCFVTDNDGHWYRIPVSKREEFHDWCECEVNGFDHEYPDYDGYKAMHPINYMFKIDEIKVLKEGK